MTKTFRSRLQSFGILILMNSCLRVYGEHSGKCNLTNSISDLEIFSLVEIKYFFFCHFLYLANFVGVPSEDWARIRKLQLANKIGLQGANAKSQVEAITVTSCLPHSPLGKILYLSQFTQFCECSTQFMTKYGVFLCQQPCTGAQK